MVEGTNFVGIVHHRDDDRKWAYDRESSVGKLDKALTEAKEAELSVDQSL